MKRHRLKRKQAPGTTNSPTANGLTPKRKQQRSAKNSKTDDADQPMKNGRRCAESSKTDDADQPRKNGRRYSEKSKKGDSGQDKASLVSATVRSQKPAARPRRVPAPVPDLAATPDWFVASLRETDVSASTANEIVTDDLNSDVAVHFNLNLQRGRVRESLQRGKHIIQLMEGGSAIVQVVREAVGDNADNMMEVLHELYWKGATKVYLQESKKTLSFLVARDL